MKKSLKFLFGICLLSLTSCEQNISSSTISESKSEESSKEIISSSQLESSSKESIVSSSEESSETETEIEIINIAKAIEIAKSSNGTSTKMYEIHAKVKKVTNATYGEMYIIDDTGELYVYGVHGENDEYFDKLEERPVVNDEIVLYGYLQVYNDVPEMKLGYLKSFTHEEPTFDESEYPLKTIKEARSALDDTNLSLEGIVTSITYSSGMNPSGIYLTDNESSIYVYSNDVAANVEVGNKIKIIATKSHFIAESEVNNANIYGYIGANQVEDATLISNDKMIHDIDLSWVNNISVKDLLASPFDADNTSLIYESTAYIKYVKDVGFDNYYIFDFDGVSGSYIYTINNGNDFSYLSEYDGKIVDIYYTLHNAKSTSSGCNYRLLPIKVSEKNDYVMDDNEKCNFALNYYLSSFFVSKYDANPAINIPLTYHNEILDFDVDLDVLIQNESIFEINKDNESLTFNILKEGEETITLKASIGSEVSSKEITISYVKSEEITSIKIKDAMDLDDDNEVTIQGIVSASLTNKMGFYLTDDTGSTAIILSNEECDKVEIGQKVTIKGIKKHYKKDASYIGVGQEFVDEAVILKNEYGKEDYDTSNIIDISFKDLYDIAQDVDNDVTTNIYKTSAYLFKENNYTYALKASSEDNGSEYIQFYCSGLKQLAYLDSFVGKQIDIDVALCNWNTKKVYKCCVLKASDGITTVINSLNFD